MTKYSIVIPTRDRPDTLRYSIRNVLALERDDFELVVHSCGPDARTREVVAGVDDARLRYVAASEPLPMRENWERAVSHARGRFVTVLGDDDGILPHALDVADALIEQHGAELVTWRPPAYYWPTCFDADLAGKALCRTDTAAACVEFSTAYALRWLYRFKWHYSDMPMIYNSFVSAELIGRVRAAQGRYFVLNSPDVTSGVVNACHAQRFLWSAYPLTVSGISGNSTGHRITAVENPSARAKALSEFMPEPIEQEWLPQRPNIDFEIVVELIELARRLGMAERGIAIDPADVAEYLARHAPAYPADIAAARAALADFCARRGIDFAHLDAHFHMEPLDQPAHRLEEIDGQTNIFGAARRIASYLGPYAPAKGASVGFESGALPVGEAPVTLAFHRAGNAPQMLEAGWNSPEDFGAWACDHEAQVVLPPLQLQHAGGVLELHVEGRGPIVSEAVRLFFAVEAGGCREAICGELNHAQPRASGTLQLDARAFANGERLRLDVRSLVLVNPALLGAGADNRPLGFGLESVVLRHRPAGGAT